MKAQRLRVMFSRGEEMKYVTHLDMMRFWERALRRAELPISYSEGFSPHAQIALAAPLPVGTTSEAELMDVFFDEPVPPRAFVERMAAELPGAIQITGAEEVGLALPSLQAEVRAAGYDIDVRPDPGCDVHHAVRSFLDADSIPWEHKREDQTRSYDIRALVRSISIESGAGESGAGAGEVRLKMLLRNDSAGSGRPEQVAAALVLPPPVRIHRTSIVLAGTSPSHAAWRRHGRFVS